MNTLTRKLKTIDFRADTVYDGEQESDGPENTGHG